MSHILSSPVISVEQRNHISKINPLPDQLVPEGRHWTILEITGAIVGAVAGVASVVLLVIAATL